MIRSDFLGRVGVFATCLVALAVIGATCQTANAVVLAQWTFENFPDPPGTLVPASGVVPEAGLYAASSAASVNTGGSVRTQLGNGSQNSYHSNGWNVGEAFVFKTVSTGYGGIKISWDQTGSSRGPRDFKVQYSTNGSSFFDIFTAPSYTVLLNGPSGTWNATTAHAAYSYSRDLSAILALYDQPMIFLRLINTSTAGISGGTVNADGASRVDNFNVTATAIPLPPAVFVFLGVAAFAGVARRRIQSLLN